MNNSSENPYAAPQSELQPCTNWFESLVQGGLTSWVMMYLINLPLLTMLGWNVCAPAGRYGMIGMIVVMLVISSGLSISSNWLCRRLVVGAAWIFVGQFLPLFHIFIGFTGLKLAVPLGFLPEPTPFEREMGIEQELDFAAAMFVTTFVGCCLFVAALLLGMLFYVEDANIEHSVREIETPTS